MLSLLGKKFQQTTLWNSSLFFQKWFAWNIKYSWLSLSWNRLSWITAYLEVKILSLPKHENLTSKKYCGKEEKLLQRSNFFSFPQYFRYISNTKSPVTYRFVKCGCLNYFFLNSENLICRGTDISKCFRESLGIRDIESQLYYFLGKVRKLWPIGCVLTLPGECCRLIS